MEKTKRKSIPYLVGSNKLSDKDFVKLLNFLSTNQKLTPNNSSFSEKIDGFGFRFGVDEDLRFFIESSRSGPVYESGVFNSYTEKKFGKINEFSEAYESLFLMLGKNQKLQNVLNKYPGCKVVCECLFTNLGIVENDRIKFVKTWYDKDKLGTFATFALIKLVDKNGNEIQNNIGEELLVISDEEIKFINPKLENYDICFCCENNQYRKFLEDYGRQNNFQELLFNKRDTSLKSELEKLRTLYNWKFKQSIKTGILGDSEGFVVVIDELIFKII